MAETASVPAAAETELGYRPVSGLAIVGLAVGVLYAALMVANAVAGLVAGVPFFLSGWFLLIPLVGIALAVVASWRINRSEGARAGKALARWGLVINGLCFLGLGAFSFGTSIAVRQQAEKVLIDFFTRLQEPDGLDLAFLMTREPDVRGSLSSARATAEIEDRFDKWRFRGTSVQPGELTSFRGNFLVRYIHQAGPDAKVTIRSVRKSEYRDNGYWVTFLVDIRTPELSAQSEVTVRSRDRAGAEREWFVQWSGTPSPNVPLKFYDADGKLTENYTADPLVALRLHSHMFATEWLQDLQAGRTSRVRAGARKPEDFGPGGSGIVTNRIRNQNRQGWIRTAFERLLALPPGAKNRLSFGAHFMMCCQQGREKHLPSLAYWQLAREGGRLQITHEVTFPLQVDIDDAAAKVRPYPAFVALARLVVERADARGLTFDWKHPPKWRVLRLEIDRVERLTIQQEKGTPPGPR